MLAAHGVFRDRSNAAWGFLVVLGAAAIAGASARDHAGAWNDGSRLATVECLVDRGTLAIDDSIFVQVPRRPHPSVPGPYPAEDLTLVHHGTRDKLFINGHFYSDKSPVPALLLAGVYRALQETTGLTARERPDDFCRWMTLASSGVAYIVAVWCVFQLGRPLQLPCSLRLVLAASFALSTVALPYVRHVNNHLLLLGTAAALLLGLAWLSVEARAGQVSWLRLLRLGTLAGLGYTIDLGVGPVLLACTLALVAFRSRCLGAVAIFTLAALPWLALHHAVNYAVGGTLVPANAVAEYLHWPGSPFTTQNMTGALNHSPASFLTYAAALLLGKRGFIGHNLPLFLALPGMVVLLRQRSPERPEVLFAGCWCGGTWLAYALTSNNYSGLCCSVRWFVPLLAAGYYVLAVVLRRHPCYRGDFLILSAWGAVLGGIMWWHGPWIKHLVPFFWPVQAAALVSWIEWRAWCGRWERPHRDSGVQGPGRLAEAA
jgi:hypothetical protein